jgi:hypothetical protein
MPNPSDDGGLKVWAIAIIAAGAGFATILAACICFICCMADPDEEPYKVPDVSKSTSSASKKSKTTSSSSKEDLEEDSEIFGKEQLETRSITSQDSSKFTYNPRSIRSNDAYTFASFNTNSSHVESDVESWQKSSTINQSVAVPFGQDISVIEKKKDLSHIVEKDDESGSSSQDISAIRGVSVRNHVARYQGNIDRNSLDFNGAAQDVIEDLNDLSRQVAHYRKSAS